MDPTNPYAAPQTPMSADPPRRFALERAAELQPLIQGAGYCHDALTTLVCTPVMLFMLWLFFSSATLLTYILPSILMFALFLHFYGLIKLVQVPRDSQARGLLLTALLLYTFSTAGILALFIMLWSGEYWAWALWLSLGNTLIRFCSYAVLLWGIHRIGRFVERPTIWQWSMSALACLAAVLLLELLSASQSFDSLMMTISPDWMKTIAIVWGGSLLLAAVLTLVFYGLALKSLMRLDELLSPAKAEFAPIRRSANGASPTETPRPLGENA